MRWRQPERIDEREEETKGEKVSFWVGATITAEASFLMVPTVKVMRGLEAPRGRRGNKRERV